MPHFSIAPLALPGVATLISFLAYGSQILFRYIEPSPLTRDEAIAFNVLVCCIWICYFRACFTNPGTIPLGWAPPDSRSHGTPSFDAPNQQRQRWCRKCKAPKPPRAHHCKSCLRYATIRLVSSLLLSSSAVSDIAPRRCIPKMDHHCPWTVNCVSYRTFPHFFRFLIYAVAAMCYLEYLLDIRASFLWGNRALPSVRSAIPLPLPRPPLFSAE